MCAPPVGDVAPRVKQYEIDSELLIAEAVECTSAALPKVEGKLKVFREQIQKDYEACLMLPDYEGKRMCLLVIYIK